MKPVSMSFETGFIVLRKYLRWPTQLLASAYGYMVNEKRGTPEDAPPPIKIIGCRIINLPYYLAIMIVTRFSAFSAKGCTRAPLDSSVMRSEGILYFFVSIQTTAATRLAAMRSLMTS